MQRIKIHVAGENHSIQLVRETHRRLKVTLVLRPGPCRRITNVPALQRMLLSTGVVDFKWLLDHTMFFEGLSFSQQVAIMSETDVLLSVQAAALLNGIMMREGSAVVALFNARFIEFFLGPPLHQAVRR